MFQSIEFLVRENNSGLTLGMLICLNKSKDVVVKSHYEMDTLKDLDVRLLVPKLESDNTMPTYRIATDT